jgi:hypothetical protein
VNDDAREVHPLSVPPHGRRADKAGRSLSPQDDQRLDAVTYRLPALPIVLTVCGGLRTRHAR